MSFSLFSFQTAILWFGLFVLAEALFSRSRFITSKYGLTALLFFLALAIVRLFAGFEFKFARNVELKPLTALHSYLNRQVLNLGHTAFSISDILLCIWAGVAILLISVSIIQYISLTYRLRKLPMCTDQRILSVLSEITENHHAKVQVIKSAAISAPAILGFLHPIILFPDIDVTEQQLHYILMHEWTHYLSKDTFKKLFVHFICSVFWWYPPSYLLKHDLNYTLEFSCDHKIIQNMTEQERLQYAETLLLVARNTNMVKKNPPFSLGVVYKNPKMKRNSAILKNRFKMIINPEMKNARIGSVIFFIIVLCLFFTSFCFVFQPVYAPDQNNPSEFKDINPDYCFIRDEGDGNYTFIMNGIERMTVSDELKDLLISSYGISIIKEN